MNCEVEGVGGGSVAFADEDRVGCGIRCKAALSFIFSCLLLLSFSFPLRAQVGEPRTDLAVGINAGLAMNTMSFKPSVRQSMRFGPTVGLTARYTCEKYFKMLCAFQGEINYSQAGWKESPETDKETYQRTLHYIHMPLLANLGFGKERGGVKGFLTLGPQLGFCVGEKTREGERYNVPQALVGGKDQHELGVEKRFEYGITGGLGMDVSTRSGHHFIVEGRYFYGLSDIFGNTKKDPFGRSANSTIFVKLSYLFDAVRTK